MFRRWLALGLALAALGSPLQAQPALEAPVRQFLAQQPALQGRDIRIKWPARQAAWPNCPAPVAISLAGPRPPVGWVSLIVRCDAQRPAWQRTLQVQVQVQQRYLAAARNLMPGQVLSAEDLVWAEGDTAHLGAGTAQDLATAVGQELRRPVAEGSPLRLNILRPVTVIRQGTKVSLIIRGPGFDIETEGQAMDNAAIGGMVRVLVREGTVVPAQATAPGMAVAR